MTKHYKNTELNRHIKDNIDLLNEIFEPLDYKSRIAKLYEIYNEAEVLMTSSFGTRSIFILDHVNNVNKNQRIHFIDTTYHFKETLAYKEELTTRYNLDVIEVLPNKAENEITRSEMYWNEHPLLCCSINKVVPIEPVVAKHKIWISGLMAFQTSFRSRLRVFEKKGDIIKFHPLIDIDEGELLFHLAKNKLPRHPLEAEGYGSVGCVNCTAKGEGRSGRWSGKTKTECGIHPRY